MLLDYIVVIYNIIDIPRTISTVELEFGPRWNAFYSACDINSIERHFLVPYFQIAGRSWKKNKKKNKQRISVYQLITLV